MIEQHIKTSFGNVYYWSSEKWDLSRDTLFFFHGLTADHTMFEQQEQYFSDKYNIIMWDAPGHGKSRPYCELTLENSSLDIFQIMKENQIEHFIAIAQSYGGCYVQAFMLRYPDKVKAFIGIGTFPYGKKYYSKSDKFWLRQVEWMTMCYPSSLLKKAAARQATVTQAGYDNMMAMISPYSKKEYAHLMQTVYNAFLEDNRDMDISCPVLITCGEHDKAGKVKKYSIMWAKSTGYPLIVIKNAGHNANVHQPLEVNKVMESFLTKAGM